MKTLHTIYSNFAKRNFSSLRLWLVMFLTLTVSAEVWGADYSKNESWSFNTSGNSNWTSVNCGSYCGGWGKNKDASPSVYKTDIQNFIDVDFSKYENVSLTIYVTAGHNSGTNSYTVKLIDKSGSQVSSYTITKTDGMGSGSNSSSAKESSVTFNPTQSFSGYRIDFYPKSYITKTRYVLTYDDKTVSYSVSWTINPIEGGSLSATSGNTTTVTPNTAYTYGSPAYTVTSGKATVLQSNNTFTATPTANSTIQINMVEKPKYTVTLMDDNTTLSQLSVGDAITLPSRAGCTGYTFEGWTKSWTEEQEEWTTTVPTIIPAGSYTPTANENLYPVYTKTVTSQGGGSGNYELVTSAPDDWSGTYLIVDGTSKNCFNGSLTTLDANGNYKSVTISDNTITSNTTTDSYSVIISKSTTNGKYYIKTSSGYYIGSNATDSSKDNELDASTSTKYDNSISISSNNVTIKGPDHILKFFHQTNANWRFRYYKSTTTSNVRLPQLYKKGSGTTTTTYYISIPNCCTQLAEVTNLEFSSITSNNIAVGVPNTYTGKANASGYIFNCYSASTGGSLVATADENGTSHTFTGLTKNTTYYFTVIAKGEGDYCNSVETSPRESSKTLAQYTVTLNPNGGIGDFSGWSNYTMTIDAGTEITLPTLSKTGYDFAGWHDGTATVTSPYTPTKDITLTAQWTAIEYTITYNDTKGATNSNPTTYTIENEITFADLTNLPKGYNFTGWDHTSISKGTTGNQTVTAQWTEKALTRYRTDCDACIPLDGFASIDGTYHFFPGETITLTVTPPADAVPYTYQWQKLVVSDWTDIAGAITTIYTKDETTIADAGRYRCVVSSEGYCDAIAEYDVKCLQLYVYYDNKSDVFNAPLKKVDGETATIDVELQNAGYTYYFKITDGCGNWYGFNGDIHSGWCTDVQMNADAYCGLQTTKFGTYVFNVNYFDLSNLKVSVLYPSAYQAADKVIYLDNNVLKWTNSNNAEGKNKIYYRIGRSDHNSKHAMTLVPGTANLYKVTTGEYDNFDVWHLANNGCWSDDGNSIYRTNTGDGWAATQATAFETLPITSDVVTVTPTDLRSKGGDENNNNCEFYNYDITEGMKTWNAQVVEPTNGTITVKYTHHDGTAVNNFTSGTRDLAHTCLLTITATPNVGYSLTSLTVNDVPFTSGNVHTLAEDAVIKATFTINTHVLTWNVNGGNPLTGEYTQGSVDYGTPIVQPADPTCAGHTFKGWIDQNGQTTVQTTMPDYDLTYTAQWQINQYTVTLKPNYPAGKTGTFTDKDGNTINGNLELIYDYNTVSKTITDLYTSLTLDGYEFGGWYNANGSNPGEVSGSKCTVTDNITGDKTYYAKWTKLYSITLSENGTTKELDPQTSTSYTLPTELSVGTCDNDENELVGWSTVTIPTPGDKPTTNFYDLGETVTLTEDQTTFYAVFAKPNMDAKEISIAGGDMKQGAPDWWVTYGTGTYSNRGVKFDHAGDYILSPSLGDYSDLLIKLKAGHNDGSGSVLTFYAYKKDNSLFGNDEVTITPTTLTPTDSYTNQETVYEISIVADEPIQKVMIQMTSKNKNLGMEYCEIFALPQKYFDYTTTCLPKHSITYDFNGGEGNCENEKVTHGEDYTICDEEPTRAGYTFLYWANGEDTYAPGTTIENVQADITLTATWQEREKYTLTFNDQGDTKEFQYIESLPVEMQEPWADICSGPIQYVFDGWAKSPVNNGTTEYEKVDFSTFTMPNNNTTILYAVYRYAEDGGEPVNGFVKVKKSRDDWTGNYVIVNEDAKKAIGNSYNNSNTLTAVDVRIESEEVISPTDEVIWQIRKDEDNYTMYNTVAGKYAYIIGADSKNAGLSDSKQNITVSWGSSASTIRVCGSGDYTNRCFSYFSDKTEWRTYSTSGNSTGTLYRQTDKIILYTSSLICGSITAEDAVVTSTKEQPVKVNVPITLESSNGTTTITASSDNTAFTVVGLTDVEAGEHTIVVEYTPTDYNTTETANISLTATNGATATFKVTGYSLPEKFAVVVEKDGKYFALPANMPSAGTYAGYEVEVKDNAVTSAPTTYVYSLSAVHSTRYADHGTAVRFVGNDDKCLWASTSKNAPTSIRNYAEADNAKSEQYEWTLYTEDGVTYTITSTTTAGRQLRMKGDNFGQYASGANTFRFLPIETKTYTPTALSSKFSVAKDKKVQFSAGNLQYHTGDNAWRFAEQQYQYMGDNNKNISTPDFNDWIDMFGWSADGKYGVNASENNADYQGTFVDWGTLFPGDWYTLSKDEWIYLLHSRASASQLKQLAKVGDVYGVLLFPDEWVMPNDITPSMEDTYSTYTLDQWEQLEAAGAVFLPAAGRRIGNDQVNTNYYTYYWTNTKEAENKVYYLINCNALGNDQYEYALPQLWYEKGYYGQSVRLVRECIEPEKPQALSATFSVSATEQVQFSAGNLQYHTGEQVWRFAPEQYDVVGQPNTNIGNPNFKDWVDMFGWSADGNFGVNPSNNQDDYKQEFLDWGKVFSEDEYGVSADEWYTLSKDEWNYLLYTRPNASSLKQVAIVGEMIGVLLFPDNWVMPAGVTTSMQIDADGVEYYPYTLDQWKQLEAAGAVFLPAAGRRTGGWGNTTVSPHIEDKENPDNFDSEGYYRWQDNTNYYGYYWTSTKDDSDGKSYFLITCKMSDDGETGNPSLPSLWKEDGRYGQSVRLVRKCAQLQVVEWKENSIVIMYNGDPAQTATVTINNEQKGIATLSDSEVARDIAVYELPATGLASSPNQPLEIAIGNAKALMTIPYIATGNATDAPANSDLVILKDATYTVNGEQLRNVTVYGGGKLVVGNGASLSTSTLTLRIGGVKDGNYDYVYPQFILNGTWTNTSGKINLDYLTTKEQYYTFVAPFAVNTKDIKYPVDIYGSNVAPDNTGSFEFQYYDGAARAEGKTGWTVVPEGDDGANLEAGQGYTFLGMPKKINGTRQKYGIHRIPMSVSAADAMSHEKTDQTISVAPHPSAKNNNSGWNLIGNPYMATIGGLTNEDIQVGKLVHTTDANGNWTGGWHWDTSTETTNQRFLVIPSNDGQSYEAVQTSNATLHAFKNFFVQIGNKDANALVIPYNKPTNVLAAPARRTEEVDQDIELAIVLEQDEAHSDQLDFLINNIYTEDFERDADFTKMMNATNLNLYGVHPYDNLSFVAIDNNTARGSVAIGYQVPQAGEYTLRMSDKPYIMWDKFEALYVTDHEMSPEVTTDIMSEPYRFTVANAETNHTRFTVSVILKVEEDDGGGDVGTGVDNTTNNNTPCKFIYQDKMYILRNGVIYDAMGKQVQTINK